jgi:hypothetical protein
MIKKDFLAKSRLRDEIKVSREKLAQLMPEFVLERINTYEVKENFIADDAGEICVIFCDICYFDDVVKDCKDKIIDILEDLFRNIDGSCKNFGVQKIEVNSLNEDSRKNLHGVCRTQVHRRQVGSCLARYLPSY